MRKVVKCNSLSAMGAVQNIARLLNSEELDSYNIDHIPHTAVVKIVAVQSLRWLFIIKGGSPG